MKYFIRRSTLTCGFTSNIIQFQEIEPIVLKHVEVKAGKSFTQEARVAWQKMVDVAFKVIVSALDSKEENS